MNKVLAATLIAATALAGTAAFAENSAAEQRERLEQLWQQSRGKSGQATASFGVKTERPAPKIKGDDWRAENERIRARFEQPDRVGRCSGLNDPQRRHPWRTAPPVPAGGAFCVHEEGRGGRAPGSFAAEHCGGSRPIQSKALLVKASVVNLTGPFGPAFQ